MKKVIPVTTSSEVINLAMDTIGMGKQALVFVNTKPSAEKTAEEISNKIRETSPELEKLAISVLKALPHPTKQCRRLAQCIRKGIAFHHSGLAHKQRELIETNFRNKVVKIISCTPTLALGLDLPAFRVIIKDLKRYGHHGLSWIPVLEYLQQSGRAGRPTYDNFGESIAIAKSASEKKTLMTKYVRGQPEEIFSKLAVEPVLRTYLLSLIAANLVNDNKEIMQFFERTFWAYQFQDMGRLEAIIHRMLRLLEEWEFISIKGGADDFVSADAVGANSRIRATLLGKRVAELYLDPMTAHELITRICLATSKQKVAFSWLHMVSLTLEMRPLLRVRAKEYEDIEEAIAVYQGNLLMPEPSLYEADYEEYANSIKTALFLQDWIDEKDEDYLLEKYSIRPGEIRAKLDIADWLFYSSEELTKILNFKELLGELMKMRLRLKYGAKEELFPLLRLKGIGRVRARKLFSKGICDVGALKKADIKALGQIIGKETAAAVKKQVGDGKDAPPADKEQGQLDGFRSH